MSEALEAQLDILQNENAFLKKYFALRQKCEQIQQANEKVVNRIQHVKKMIKRYKRERRYLANRLDDYGDNYRDVQVPVMWEEDKLLGATEPCSSFEDVEKEISSPMSSTDRTAKKSKADTNAPKKPANAFLLFCTQQRSSVQEEYYKDKHEEISNHEMTKRLAQKWNGLTPEQKKVYYDMYEHEKERYDKEVKEYHERNSKSQGNVTQEVQSMMGKEAQSAVDALMMDT
ncbi:NHP10 [Mytilus edulis]|uniref:NHP10 n=1 Tax=Mytilus edulis TaxID=6550 RepID=A0A8S3UNY5_MYTED|nr:NHP10 [Mytilus edulis]